MKRKRKHLHDTTTVESAASITSMQYRRQHQAAFDSALKEIFLKHQVQLREPLARASKHTVVYSGLFHGEEVAVKILTLASDSPIDAISTYGAFKVECEKTMVLSRRSQHILEVLEYGDADIGAMPSELKVFFPLGLVPFMIIEKAPYGSLDKVTRNLRRLPGFSRLDLYEALAFATDGIKESHMHAVAHRDIKPQNILIFAPRKGKIADFGIARWRSRIKELEVTELTPKYSSPEQAFHVLTGRHEGLVGISGDIYSWAIMLYELVTGRHPFQWAVQPGLSPQENQRAVLQAIAANDRRGFKETGDITFDMLMMRCTDDLKRRINDIALANQKLREFIRRHRD